MTRKEKKVDIHIRIPAKMREMVREMADVRGQLESEAIRDIITVGLEALGRRMRKAS